MNARLESEAFPPEILEKLRRKTVRGFMGIVVLAEMKNRSMNLNDVLSLIHERFDVMLSPNTVRSLLWSLEEDGLIKKIWDKRKASYELTDKGKKDIKVTTKKCVMGNSENCAYSLFFGYSYYCLCPLHFYHYKHVTPSE